MQRQEFLQQLWLDYIHLHPELGALRVWPIDAPPEYLALLTLNHGRYAASSLLPTLQHFGYRPMERYAMADRGLLATLLAAPDDGAWLVLGELQLNTLPRSASDSLKALVATAHPDDSRGQNLLCRGRPWPMPDWQTFQQLETAHPLAAWLAVMGPRMHHAGFDSERLGHELGELDQALRQTGLIGSSDRHHGVFPISPLLNYRFYPTCSRRLAFAAGDEHRIALGGLALVQKCLPSHHERAAELLLPQHTRCEIA
ncbi:DUF1338 domain-containing protein [Halomonas sp. ML-15]|uniref:DUF1338 domain-containing protein n=1 Tax=Halomonas sp. ML-15 TaxID=2773305 RepID=UPI001747AC94|nr:DUF1338 domain-containing protein [Halomonas sp. ML-15]MBD3894310.1 DUF1338 domain-containing protein [Halomonas sp. ML-15]